MSGTVTNFTPSVFSLFTFHATLDGQIYTCNTTWNISRAGQKTSGWYLNVYSQSNILIVSKPLVSSAPPPSPGINLVWGYFKTSALYFYGGTQTFLVTP